MYNVHDDVQVSSDFTENQNEEFLITFNMILFVD